MVLDSCSLCVPGCTFDDISCSASLRHQELDGRQNVIYASIPFVLYILYYCSPEILIEMQHTYKIYGYIQDT